jgi:prepilin-type N-terminal cleavage/methylation domain-containing protein
VRPNLPIQHVRPGARRRGLTLIELIVVLMILIALAGLLIPMLPSMLTRAHTSTSASNMGDISRAITTYQQLYQGYPSNWDALGDGTKIIDYFANGSALPASQGGPGANPGNGELTGLTLTANEASALAGVGITQVQAMIQSATGAPAGFDPTFNNYPATATPQANAINIATGTVLAGLDPTNAANTAAIARAQRFNLPLTGRYVALGLGPRVSMVGKTIQSAPVHFGDTPVLNPEYGYERFVALFKVSDTVAGPNFTQAQLVAVAEVEDTGLGSIDDHLQEWYQLTTGGS